MRIGYLWVTHRGGGVPETAPGRPGSGVQRWRGFVALDDPCGLVCEGAFQAGAVDHPNKQSFAMAVDDDFAASTHGLIGDGLKTKTGPD